MKTFVHVLLIAACFAACARSYPSRTGYDLSDKDDLDSVSFDFDVSSSFSDFVDRIRKNLFSYFWNIPDFSNLNIPEGANSTSTTKVIDGHVVTINETTYNGGDAGSSTVFRIRTIDVKPLNETIGPVEGDNTEPSVKSEPEPESRETVEDFNNEISKNTETLTA